MTISYDAKVLRLAQAFQANGDVRTYLNGIHLMADGTVVGTNGHVLAVSKNANPVSKHTPAPDVDTIVRFHRPIPKTADHVDINFANSTVKCWREYKGGPDKGKLTMIKEFGFEQLEGRYPDHQRVIPVGPLKPTSEIGVNAHYLSVLSVLANESKYGSVRLEFRGPDNAIAAIPTDGGWHEDTRVVIMPMRL